MKHRHTMIATADRSVLRCSVDGCSYQVTRRRMKRRSARGDRPSYGR